MCSLNKFGSGNMGTQENQSSPQTNSITVEGTFPGDTGIEMTLVNSSLENIDNSRLPDVVAETKIYESDTETHETYLAIAIQVFIPFLIAGFGMVGAGLVLDLVQVKKQTLNTFADKTTYAVQFCYIDLC